ncbi:Flavonoid 4'-O-methyltransferase [Spatholobus suberectus]|nr:Flavonoid 4'-O-methyltransferase [Spatholobus suberectus]
MASMNGYRATELFQAQAHLYRVMYSGPLTLASQYNPLPRSKRLLGFIHQNPTHMKTFNEAMESDSQVVRLALRDCKSVFEGLDSMVDVGDATGNTAKIICKAFPNLKYVVLDLPQVVTGLTGSKNLSFVGGNTFKSIPQADAILLKWALHNWSDDDCIKILKNCKDAISGKGKGGKVIIIDIVINE